MTTLVIIESPYAGETELDIEYNVAYARAAMADCLRRGEAPYASHVLYTQPGVLNDKIPEERRQGIEAGLAWGQMAAKTVVYLDNGMSRGMQQGIDRAKREGRIIEYRRIEGWPEFEDWRAKGLVGRYRRFMTKCKTFFLTFIAL